MAANRVVHRRFDVSGGPGEHHQEKEARSAQYHPRDAYWLLIVVEPMDAAQEQEIRIDGLSVASAVFDKIFVYKPTFEHIVEVKS